MTKKKQPKLPVVLPRNRSKRQPKKLRGRGDYVEPSPGGFAAALDRLETKVDKALAPPTSTVGSSAGRFLGSLVGQGDLGSSAGQAFENWWRGHGDYTITANTLIPGLAEATPPAEFSRSGRRGVRVVEREYIGDLISASSPNTFNNTSFRINPADPSTFPWLSPLAAQFEEYTINGMIFEFKTTSSTFNGTGQSLGTVIMATDYDSIDSPYTTKLQMENADYANSTVTCASALHGVECQPRETPVSELYCAVYPPTTGDRRLYDFALFQIATFGVNAASVNLGEIWVSYDITFYKKQLEGGQLGLTSMSSDIVASNSYTPSYTGVTNLMPLGTNPLVYGTIPMTVTSVANVNVIAFPPTLQTGFYELEFTFEASTVVGISTIVASPNNCVVVPYTTLIPPPASTAMSNSPLSTSPYADVAISTSLYIIRQYLQITGSRASFTHNGAGSSTGSIVFARLSVRQVPPPQVPLVYLTT